MIQHKLRRLLQSQIKTAETIIMRLILTGNNNHLIISRHTMLFRKKSLAWLTCQFQLMQFKIAIPADYRINLPLIKDGLIDQFTLTVSTSSGFKPPSANNVRNNVSSKPATL